MAGNKNKNLPPFTSVNELVAFFESHDMGEYWEQLPETEVEVSVTKKVVPEIPKYAHARHPTKDVKNQSSYYRRKK